MANKRSHSSQKQKNAIHKKAQQRKIENRNSQGMSRRDFLRNAGIGVIGLGASGLLAKEFLGSDKGGDIQTTPEPTYPPTSHELPQPTEAERAEIIQKVEAWIKDADQVAQRTNNPHALEVMDFIHQNQIAGKVVPGGVQFIESKKTDDYVMIAPTNRSDIQANEGLEKLSKGMGALFNIGSRSIKVFDDVPMSPEFRGIIFLHEASHAFHYIFKRDPYDINVEAKLREEVNAHIFHIELTRLLGGDAFNSLVANTKETVVKPTYDSGASNLEEQTYNPELETIFGPALSEQEKIMRRGIMVEAALFEFYDERFTPEQAQIAKMGTTYKTYREGDFDYAE